MRPSAPASSDGRLTIRVAACAVAPEYASQREAGETNPKRLTRTSSFIAAIECVRRSARTGTDACVPTTAFVFGTPGAFER